MSQSPPAPKQWPAMPLAQARAMLTGPGSRFEIEDKIVRGVPTRVWKNAPPTLRDVFFAGAAHADRVFLVYEDERVTFRAFSRAALGLAHALVESGVRKGDRVVIAMRNLPEWPVAFFGALLAGAIATPLNAWGTGPELEFGLNDSGAKVAMVDAERLDRLGPRLRYCHELEHLIVSRESEDVAHPL